jgi:hypothetical protein
VLLKNINNSFILVKLIIFLGAKQALKLNKRKLFGIKKLLFDFFIKNK